MADSGMRMVTLLSERASELDVTYRAPSNEINRKVGNEQLIRTYRMNTTT